MHPARPVVAVGTALAALSLLLPLATFPVIGPVDGIDGDAWPVLLPLAPVLAGALLGDRALGHRAGVGIPMLVAACLAIVFAAAKAADASRAVSRVGEGAAVGFGAWAVLVCTGVVAAGEVLALVKPPR